jgi:hypothetical protein
MLRMQSNSARRDEHFFSLFLSSFPDSEKRLGFVNPAYFSHELLVKTQILDRNENFSTSLKPLRWPISTSPVSILVAISVPKG